MGDDRLSAPAGTLTTSWCSVAEVACTTRPMLLLGSSRISGERRADFEEEVDQAAYAGYQEVSERYIAELKRPRIRLGSVIGLLGAVGVGVVVGSTIP